MIEIKEYGGIYEVDQDGVLVPEGSVDKIVPPWSDAVAYLVSAYQKILAESCHSVYVRGSIARGFGVEGLSDLDSTCYAHKREFDLKEVVAWGEKTRQEYAQRFPFSHRPEIDIKFLEDEREKLHTMRWFKRSAACVYGEDLLSRIPTPTLQDMIDNSGVTSEYINEVTERFFQDIGQSATDKLSFCRWICKRYLRAASALVLPRTLKVTNDLYYCYTLFSEIYPQQDSNMRRALELVLNPTETLQSYEQVVRELRDFFVAEADRDQAQRAVSLD